MTLFLLLSVFTLQIAYRHLKTDNTQKYIMFLKWMEMTLPLGLIFFLFLETKWLELIRLKWHQGFRISLIDGVVGFYGFFVLVGLGALNRIKYRANRGFYYQNISTVNYYRIYWFVVVGFWPLVCLLT